MQRTVLLLASVAAALLLASGAASESGSAQTQTQPNVLFILTDDQREGMLGVMPNVRKKIQNQGVTFANFYVTQSWCCPSRVSFLTGLYPHNHGVTSLARPDGGEGRFRELGGDQSTTATWLDGAGYNTAYIGKYLNGYSGAYVPPGWDTWVAQQRFAKGWGLNRNGTVGPRVTGSSTYVYRAAAMRFLGRATDSPNDPPFFLWLATNAPHPPVPLPKEPKTCYERGRLPANPAINEKDVSDKSAFFRSKPRFSKRQLGNIKEVWCRQKASLKIVDSMVGQVLDLLAKRGELANTYVVFASDNGIALGEHRYYAKRGAKRTPYEEAAGVPFIVRGPGVATGVTARALAANNDFAPTVASLAAVDIPYTPDGRSLSPVLADGRTPPDWRSHILNESHSVNAGGGEGMPGYDALLTGSETYVEWETGEKEFYNLRSDPYQLENSYDSLSVERTSALAERLAALKRCSADSCRGAEGS